jgi:predicted RND superfamily exporter protein/CRP-like cAMP-binding protein
MAQLTRLPLEAPRATLLVLALLSGLAARSAIHLRVDSSVDNLLSRTDPAREYYESVRERFGNEEVTVVGVFADDVYAPTTLAKIDRLSTRLAALDGVHEVLSLTTAQGAVSEGGSLKSGRLLEALPTSAADAAAFRDRIRSLDVYDGVLFGADDRSTAINVFYEPMSDRAFLDSGLEPTIRRILDEVTGPESFAITGMPTLKAQAALLILRDLAIFVPLSTLVVAIVLAWSFRTPRGVLLPLSTVLLSLVWTAGFVVAMGSAITFGTLIVAPLLIAIGSAYSIHIMTQYNRALAPGRSGREIVGEALADVSLPLGVAGVTTLIGFLTFVSNPIPTIREFGLFSAFGVVCAIVLSLTLLPAALTLLPVSNRPVTEHGGPSRFRRFLDGLATVSADHNGWVLAGFALLTGVALVGMLRLHVETDYLGFFPAGTSVRVDNARIADHLAGTQPVSVVIDGYAERALLRPEVFDAVTELQRFLDAQVEIDKTISFVDYLTVVKRGLLDEPDAPPPSSGAQASQLLMLIDPTTLGSVVTPDFARASILVRTRHEGSRALHDLITRIEAAAAEGLPKGIDAHVTGSTVLINRSADEIVSGQVTGLLQVLVALLLVMSVLFLSLRVGAVSLIPNVFPIVILFGMMGWSDISLNLSTSLIAAIAIGIAIDDTIHFFSFFNAEVRRSADQRQAARATLRSIGPAMVVTSIALAVGFLVVALSGFVPIRDFGILTSATMLVALASDLLLTPALVQRVRIVTLWDALRLRLGPDPHRAIGMFAGLRPIQARIVVLMSRLAEAAPGTFLTRRGEDGAALFVVLSGTADVLGPDGAVVHTLERGDVVGEMGALRRAPRSADVVVREPLDYLVVDEAFLERLRRRYPRTAAIVFRNLARILSDRLERTTAELRRSVVPQAGLAPADEIVTEA